MRRTIRVDLLGCLVWLAWANAAWAEEARLPIKLRVEAGEREGTDAMAAYSLPAGLVGQAVRLVETTGGKEAPIAAQLDSASGKLWWVAAGVTAAKGRRTYRLEQGVAAEAEKVVVADSEAAVEARFDGKPLLRYNKAHVEPGQGIDPKFGRSGHLHPVWTPGGAIVTDELPPDHLHQSGIFLAHTRTQFEGRNVDFWNLAGGKGRVRFKELKGASSGPVFGQFRAVHEHVDLTASEDKTEIGKTTGGKVALVEDWNVRAWNTGGKSGYWLLDIESNMRCATNSPVTMPEYHYGGMAIRAARPWVPKEVAFLTSEGDERIKGNHTRPQWCDIRGAVEGKTAGIALMTHPSNFRFPEPLRIHPTMPYMVYTPSFLGEWEISPAAPHHSRYRFVVHDGNLTAEELDRIWRNYAEPLVAVAE